ncbi:hypothetical protein F5Y18DRAFT_436361 [Xylariaceae sp. FL1019]|nr:hypothetical protein F5Y18DRAFT_436361 [Xylariaceae sp. FL1019]
MYLVYEWLASSRSGRWLIVLDSADNAGVFWGAGDNATQDAAYRNHGADTAQHLPHSPNGSVLVTTRNENIGRRLAGDHQVIRVNPMNSSLALRLLRMRLRVPVDIGLPHGEELVRELDYIPLAISQAAACLYDKRWSIRKYCDRLYSRLRPELLDHSAKEAQRHATAVNAIGKTWIMSFDQIRSQRESACDLLAVMSFLYSKNIPGYLLKIWRRQINWTYGEDIEIAEDEEMEGYDIESPGDKFDDDVLLLLHFGMIGVNQSSQDPGSIFEMHDLVQWSVQRWLRDTVEVNRFPAEYYEDVADIVMGSILMPEIPQRLEKRGLSLS